MFGRSVNICIYDFDDAKEESNKVASKDKHCFKINTRLLQQTKPCFKISLRSSLSSKQSVSKIYKALVIDYQKTSLKIVVKKSFEFEFWTCNRLSDVCNRLPATELLKFKFKSHDPSKYNYVIYYQKPIINYQWKNSKKAFWKDTSLQTILKRHKGPIYMCVCDFKKARERISKRTSLPNALSTTLGQTLANSLRVHPWTSIVISFS